jgi:hypothetical protein
MGPRVKPAVDAGEWVGAEPMRTGTVLAHVPGRKHERAGAALRHAGRGLRRRWKRSPQLGGVDCVVSTSQLAGRQLTASDRPVDGGLGDTRGPRRTAWSVHSLPVCMTPKRRQACSHAVIKGRLSSAAAPRRAALSVRSRIAARLVRLRGSSGSTAKLALPTPRFVAGKTRIRCKVQLGLLRSLTGGPARPQRDQCR